jgi:hypothetical protein
LFVSAPRALPLGIQMELDVAAIWVLSQSPL